MRTFGMLGTLLVSMLSSEFAAAGDSGGLGLDLHSVQHATTIAAVEPEGRPFSKGSFELHAYGAANLFGEHGDWYQGHVGLGWYFLDDVALGIEGIAGAFCGDENDPGTGDIDQSANSTFTYGMNLFLRWHAIHEDRWSFYVDVLGGMIFGDESPVEGGTNLNFTPGAGIGVTYELADNVHLMGGVRYIHISNANKHGTERNFGQETAQFYLGVMFPF